MALAVVLDACATPYRPQTAGDRYGYREVAVTPDVYFVEFDGNVYTDLTTATRYWHQRAHELCAQRGHTPRELPSDPTLVQDPPLPRNPFGGFLFWTGEPIRTTGNQHSRWGFIRCVETDVGSAPK